MNAPTLLGRICKSPNGRGPANRRAAAVFLLLVALAAPLSAQTPVVPVGSRVRATVLEPEPGNRLRYVGRVTDWNGRRLGLELSESPNAGVPVSLEAISKLEISHGTHRHTVLGLGIGLGAGLLAGVVSYAVDSSCPSDPLCPIVFPFFGIIGAATGTLVGWLWKTEEWETVLDRP